VRSLALKALQDAGVPLKTAVAFLDVTKKTKTEADCLLVGYPLRTLINYRKVAVDNSCPISVCVFQKYLMLDTPSCFLSNRHVHISGLTSLHTSVSRALFPWCGQHGQGLCCHWTRRSHPSCAQTRCEIPSRRTFRLARCDY
jgi:hypothetical protein